MRKSLALIVIVIVIVCIIYYKHTEPNDSPLHEIRGRLMYLFPDRMKSITIEEGTKSHIVNKRHIYLCTKDANGRYYSVNSLMYVALHEMAHVFDDDYITTPKHTSDFYDIFRSLLKHAEERGMYDSRQIFPHNYCKED